MTFAAWHTRRTRAQQKRKALQMLALSGVVRPSDVELRYPISLEKISAAQTAPTALSSSHVQTVQPLSESSSSSRDRRTYLFKWLYQELPSSS